MDTDLRERLAGFGSLPEAQLPVGEVALWLAYRDQPETRITRYMRHLETVAEHVASAGRGAQSLRDRVAALRDVIYRFHGYAGDDETYDDVQNANLIRVIDRRKGLPVALGILVLDAARAQGWDVCGLNFPGHFLLRLSLNGENTIVDPFQSLRRLGAEELQRVLERVHGRKVKLRPEFIRRVSDRDVLLRLQNNIKSRALGQRDLARAIEVLDSMVLIAPEQSALADELAQLRRRLKGRLN